MVMYCEYVCMCVFRYVSMCVCVYVGMRICVYVGIPYSRFPTQVKTFTNCSKIDLRGENFCRFTVTQSATSINAASEGLLISSMLIPFYEVRMVHYR